MNKQGMVFDKETRTWKMPDKWIDYIDWLCDPENVGKSKKSYAEEHGIVYGTLISWLKNPSFRYELEKRLAELNVHPDRVQQVVDAMHKKAAQGDVQAAKLYLEYIKFIRPPMHLLDSTPVSELTDAELARALEDAAAGLT